MLIPKIYQRAAARCDLVEYSVYLAENANLETAERVFCTDRS